MIEANHDVLYGRRAATRVQLNLDLARLILLSRYVHHTTHELSVSLDPNVPKYFISPNMMHRAKRGPL